MCIPADTTVDFNGATIHQSEYTDTHSTGRHTLKLCGSNIRLTNGKLTGRHLSGWTNAQMAGVYWDGTHSNIEIDHMVFENLVGFSAQANTNLAATGVSFHDNTITNCGNGANINCAGVYYNNTFTDSEGFEIAASNIEIYTNVFTRAQVVAISIGGHMGGAALTGNQVHDNQVYGCDGHGVTVNDGCDGATIEENLLEDCDGVGLLVQRNVSAPTSVSDTKLNSNVVRRSGHIGIYLPNISNVTGTAVDENVVEGGGDADYGLLCSSPGVTVMNSDFRGGGVTADVLLQVTAAGMTFADSNQYNTIQDQR